MSHIRIWPIILALACSVNAEVQRPFTFVVTSFECLNHTALTTIFDCSFRKLTTDMYSFEQNLMFGRDLNNYHVRQRIEVVLLHGKTTLKVLDLCIDACKGLDTVWKSPLLRALLSEVRRTSNIPTSCPMRANTLYRLKNFTVTSAFFPPYAPDADFTIQTEYFEKSILFATQIARGRISSKRYAKGRRNKKF